MAHPDPIQIALDEARAEQQALLARQAQQQSVIDAIQPLFKAIELAGRRPFEFASDKEAFLREWSRRLVAAGHLLKQHGHADEIIGRLPSIDEPKWLRANRAVEALLIAATEDKEQAILPIVRDMFGSAEINPDREITAEQLRKLCDAINKRLRQLYASDPMPSDAKPEVGASTETIQAQAAVGPAANPDAIVKSLLSEADLRRHREETARQEREERIRRLNELAAYRAKLSQAIDRICAFPSEEKDQDRKPCLEGFRRWAEKFVALGTAIRECDDAIEGLHFAKRISAVSSNLLPPDLKYACAVILLSMEGGTEPVISALAEANGDQKLRRFVLWLPYILDHLWSPFHDTNGISSVALPPDGTSREEYEQADQAFGWRSTGPSLGDPTSPRHTAEAEANGDGSRAVGEQVEISAEIHVDNCDAIQLYDFLAARRNELDASTEPELFLVLSLAKAFRAACRLGIATRSEYTGQFVSRERAIFLFDLLIERLRERGIPVLSKQLFGGVAGEAETGQHYEQDAPDPLSKLRRVTTASASEIASAIGQSHKNRVEPFLRKLRNSKPGCYFEIEADAKRATDPTYIYRVPEILPDLEKAIARWKTKN